MKTGYFLGTILLGVCCGVAVYEMTKDSNAGGIFAERISRLPEGQSSVANSAWGNYTDEDVESDFQNLNVGAKMTQKELAGIDNKRLIEQLCQAEHRYVLAWEKNPIFCESAGVKELFNEILRRLEYGEAVNKLRATLEQDIDDIDDLLNSINRANGDAPHEMVNRCDRIRVVAGYPNGIDKERVLEGMDAIDEMVDRFYKKHSLVDPCKRTREQRLSILLGIVGDALDGKNLQWPQYPNSNTSKFDIFADVSIHPSWVDDATTGNKGRG
jgi:hypothetical protein